MERRNVTAHRLHDLARRTVQQLRDRLVRNIGVAEQIAQEQRSCKPGPAAVCTSAVDAGADYILFITENTDTVIICGQEHDILRYSVLPAEGVQLIRTDVKPAL